MDSMLLRIYQEQVVYACKAVLFGVEDLQRGLEESQRGDTGRLVYGLQNLIIGAGNLSKALWGAGTEPERQRRYVERQPLRDSISVTDASPLRQVKIRNDYEHLDERIEKWWKTSPNRNYIGLLIGPRGSVGGEALGDRDILRWYDPTTGDAIFWGNELNIPAVLAEVRRILPIAEEQAHRPPWE